MESIPTTTQEIVHENTLFAEPLFHIGNFAVTNALLTSWISVLIIVGISLAVRLKLKKIPGKFQHIFEVIVDGALNLCDQVTGSRALSIKLFPYVFAIFFFVLINNWMGILPGVGSIGFVELHDGVRTFVPLLRGGTADINTTLALALMSVVGANIFGILAIGIWKTLNKYVNLRVLGSIVTDVRKNPQILIVAPIKFFVGLLEAIGEVAKVISLSFRLFGNAFAGEVLLASMAALVHYIVPAPFLFLEVFVGLIQALIFALLSLVYFTIAAQDHDEEHSEVH
jgi:F-type H+-transporting ATPase subunit a